MNSKEKIFIIDGFAQIFRNYFAFLGRPLVNDHGENRSALFGIARLVLSLFKNESPRQIIAAFDSPGKTFRHDLYPDYKANRDAAPEDLTAQVPIIKELFKAMNIPLISRETMEADDIIGSLCQSPELRDYDIYIVSSDKDLMQLLTPKVFLYRQSKTGFETFTAQTLKQEKGITPDQVIDYLALIGDTADNIPGVKGIGPKGAQTLLEKFSSLEKIISAAETGALSKGQQEKILAAREEARLSYELATIKTHLTLPVQDLLLPLPPQEQNQEAAVMLLKQENMERLSSELSVFAGGTPSPKPEGEAQPRGKYKTVSQIDQLKKILEQATKAPVISLDTETTSVDSIKARLVGISLSLKEGEGYYIPIFHDEGTLCPEDETRELFKTFFKTNPKIIGQNIKYDFKILSRWGAPLPAPYFDTMIASYLISSEGRHNLDDLARENLGGYETIKFEDVCDKKGVFSSVHPEKATQYAAEDADITLRLYNIFLPKLEKKNLLPIFFDSEMPLIPVLARMEMRGITIDPKAMQALAVTLGQETQKSAEEIFRLCGHEFNLNSPLQLQKVLFEERKLTPIKKTKSGYSTDSATLAVLAEEDVVAEKLQGYRTANKLLSTYVIPLPDLADPHDHKLHTTFSQTAAATGRLASTDPNLQNIPVRDEQGRLIRSAFLPSPGCKLISADYAQIELVVLAHFSQDPAFLEVFKEKQDIHTRTASLLFQVPESDITPQQRRAAKAINFGILYGMGAFRLAKEMHISQQEAKSFIDSYFTHYAKVREMIDQTIAFAESTGHTQTLMGRQRELSGIKSRNHAERMAAQRIALNTKIQGSAAEIIKSAMIKFDALERSGKSSASLLLQVHDELIIEAPQETAQEEAQLLKTTMESAISLNVPLRVSVEIGDRWGDFH